MKDLTKRGIVLQRNRYRIMLITFFWIIEQQERIDGLIISLLSSTILAIIGSMTDNNG